MKRGFVYLVGAGPGDPGLITVKALDALAGADCIIYDYLANPALIEHYTCEKIYVGKKGSYHTLPQETISGLMISRAKEGKVVVRLKGGDPFIFGRGGEEAGELVNSGIPFSIIPGVSSFYSAPAYAGIPLTHRDYSNAIEVITGHRRMDAGEIVDINFPGYDPDRTYVFLMGSRNLAHISSSLINEKKFPAATPVAYISWGTMPCQRVAQGTLADIADIVERENIKPPSIIVIGHVVKLRDKLRWFDTLPLFGRKVVVTRTRAQASALSKKLSSYGAEVIEFPTIDIKPLDDLSEIERAVDSIGSFDWIYFTSQNAVNIFFDVLFKKGRDVRVLGNARIAVIGPATGDELIKYGLKPDMTPKEYVAESLLEESVMAGLSGKKILLPCSEDARYTLAEGLRAMGADVERIHIYRAGKPGDISAEKVQKTGSADIITFTSSSTVNNFFSIVPETRAILACIGPVTAKTVKEHGYEPQIVAKEYTIDGLVQAIVEYHTKL